MANRTNFSEEFKKNSGRFGRLPSEELSKAVERGGEVRAEQFRQRKKLKEYIEVMAEAKVPENLDAAFEKLGVKREDRNVLSGTMLALINNALKGDVPAIKLIAQLLGELEEKVNVNHKPIAGEIIDLDTSFTDED